MTVMLHAELRKMSPWVSVAIRTEWISSSAMLIGTRISASAPAMSMIRHLTPMPALIKKSPASGSLAEEWLLMSKEIAHLTTLLSYKHANTQISLKTTSSHVKKEKTPTSQKEVE